MIDKNVALYTYRVLTSGGHAFICLVPFNQVEDFWVEVRRLRNFDLELETCYIAANQRIIFSGIDAKSIIAIDTAHDRPPMSLVEYEDTLKAQKHVNKVQKKEVRKITPAQTAGRRK